jgi:hypothetical protein
MRRRLAVAVSGLRGLGAQQGAQHRIDRASILIGAAQGGHGALARLTLLVAEGLDQLSIGVALGTSEPLRQQRSCVRWVSPKPARQGVEKSI